MEIGPMLEELGSTAIDVAKSLRAKRIQGVRNTVRFLNPIVRYAQTQLPEAQAIDLIKGDRLRIVFATHKLKELEVPEPVLRFLEEFHRGQYPELEMPTRSG
jgi:hypothetical protein